MNTTATDNLKHANENAKAWMASIKEMLEAMEGWQKAAEAEGWNGPHKDQFGATYFKNDDGATWACETWKALCEAFDIDAEQDDEARQTLEESVLSVTVREGWHSPGQPAEDGPEEYEILLSTGGPALRIYGQLGEHCEPSSAQLQVQDWGTPWTRYPAAEDTLLRFASCFWFGE